MKKTRILSIIFAAVTATFGIFAAGCGKEEKKAETTSKDEPIIISGTEKEAIPMPSALAFRGVTMLSDEGEPVTQSTSVTLTATISPSDATNQKVDWSVAFANPSSAWASGKTVTDYVTVTPTTSGSLTASVECLQAFGEQIKVTVTSRDNASAKATCTCDYYKRVTDVSVAMTQNGVAASSIKFSSDGLNTVWTVTPTYSVGTIEQETTFTLMLQQTSALLTYKGNNIPGVAPLKVTPSLNFRNDWELRSSGLTLSTVTSTNLLAQIFYGVPENNGFSSGFDTLDLNKAIKDYNYYRETYGDFLEFSVVWTGSLYGNGAKTISYEGASSDFTVGVESISVNEGTVAF